MMTNTAAADIATLLDSSAEPFNPSWSTRYRLTEIWKIDFERKSYKIRVDILVAARPQHSFALAEVLTGLPTISIDEPATTWLMNVGLATSVEAPFTVEAVHDALDPLVDRLVSRMHTILA